MKNSLIRADQLKEFENSETLISSLAEHIFTLANVAIKERGRFSFSFSGGSTPKALYEHLAQHYKEKMPWSKTQWFIGDERCVPHSSPDSNFAMIDLALLSKVPVPWENIFPTSDQDQNPKHAALKYDALMREKLPASANGFPCFDFILLGLGPDGHTASLFPGTAAIDENKRCFVENFVEKFNTYRLTSTYPVLNAARNVVFLAEGEEKAAIIKTVLMEPEAHLPSQRVKPLNGQLEWFVDRAAASLLPNGTLTHK